MDLAMYTEVNFCNLSQTYIKPEITLFQKTQENNTEKLYAWKVIKNCGHLWNHPFRIDWGYSYQFFDRHGNYSPIVALEKQSYQLSQYYEIGINFSSAQSSQVNFYKKVNNKIIGVNLLKNNRVIASGLFIESNILRFNLSDNFYICADLRVQQGAIIHLTNLNISLKKINIDKQSSIKIFLKGGQPGSGSKSLTFISVPQLK